MQSFSVKNIKNAINEVKNGTCTGITERKAPQFLVYNPDKDKPQKIYNSYEEALNDAENVANKYDECVVYVLEIKATINKKLVVDYTREENGIIRETTQYDKIPF